LTKSEKKAKEEDSPKKSKKSKDFSGKYKSVGSMTGRQIPGWSDVIPKRYRG